MTPSNNVSPLEPAATSSLRMPKVRGSADTQSIISSTSTLTYRASNASVSSLFASTSTPSGSRSASPSGGPLRSKTMSGSVFGGSPGEGQQLQPADRIDDPRNLILQAFVPHIAIHTSADTHELVKDKGFEGGLWELLRPFGERIQGKVTVRDSIGSGKTWDDFSVRFVQLGDGLEKPETIRKGEEENLLLLSPNGEKPTIHRSRTGGNIVQIEQLVDRHLTYAEDFPSRNGDDYLSFKDTQGQDVDAASPFYTLYVRRLLSGIPLAPHETFSHPVACVIAISSRNKDPIEALRQLYADSSRGQKRMPVWVNNEYLRYYVLVHDEERDDVTKSMALFDQMKRHFGLHCHLLRLRSSNCVATDDDSVQLPRCEWISASEEIADIQAREFQEDIEDSYPCIYESDMTAIKTFIREMVTQSVIPSMERCVSTWNDQVASRRRGISGRFISLSKKWTGFGSSSRSSSSNGSPTSGSNSNYNAGQGFYQPEAPEAVMRKLADYSFMLRDWKLAQSTYDLLRSDFNNDKAWKYHAAANEMAAISTLLIPQAISSKVRSETIDQMLETASYSYITRCGATYGALRSLALGMELLRLRGGSATDDAARWGTKLLDNKVVGPIGEALIKERISVCYASKQGTGSGSWGARIRKSAMWSILAADVWLTLGKPQQSKQRLDEANSKYSRLPNPDSLTRFNIANDHLHALQKEVQLALYPESAIEGSDNDLIDTTIGEETEAFDSRPHRRSLMGATAPALASLESAPLHGTLSEVDGETSLQFE
ncbi:ER-golgi trafficking TRAPP I complex 85 kDa subunit-domain-containing protein [Tricladium varicosporioides]|nr:ER-golgi trafficking TRAPP I complex 85 kDa subunit-domain-containing protein [Hymenoscyphus varicosporioides]